MDDTQRAILQLRDATSHALSILTLAYCSQADAAHIHKNLVRLTNHKAEGTEELAFELLQRSIEAADFIAQRRASASTHATPPKEA